MEVADWVSSLTVDVEGPFLRFPEGLGTAQKRLVGKSYEASDSARSASMCSNSDGPRSAVDEFSTGATSTALIDFGENRSVNAFNSNRSRNC